MHSAHELIASRKMLVIAHRGDSHRFPENTLPALAAAASLGVDLVELDYRHSSEGIPVVFHDETLDRVTDAVAAWGRHNIPLEATSLKELHELDAGSWFAPRFAGTSIPTLSDACDVIRIASIPLIERKSGDPETCVRLLRRKNLLDCAVVQAFDWEYLRECRRLAPQLALCALGDFDLTKAALEEMAGTGASVVGWDERRTNREAIAAAHDRGFKIWTWTADDPVRIRQLMSDKIDGIITNLPEQLLAMMKLG
jgi:glycerophosphoryl diester phosphodiesterase